MVKCLVFVGSIFNNLAKNLNFGEKSKVSSKFPILDKNRKYRQTFQFWKKSKVSPNFPILEKNRKSKFFGQIFNFGQNFQLW